MKNKSLEEKEKVAPSFSFRRLATPIFLALFLILLSSLALALSGRLQFFELNLERWLGYHYFQAGSEGLMLSETGIVRSGGSIYIPLGPGLFISAPYPPLYYYLLAGLWFPGENAAAGFTIGRVISLISALAAAFFIACLVILEGRPAFTLKPPRLKVWLPVLGGVLAGLLFLSMPAVTVWAARVRADMLMVAFQLLGLVLVAWRPRGWPAFAALLPLTLALYTKHTGISAAAAAAIFFLIQNWPDRRKVLTWAGTFAALTVGPFVFINFLTGLEFYRRLFPYHQLGWNDSNFKTYLELFWGENLPLLIMGGSLFLISLFWPLRNHLSSRLSALPLAGWYLLFSLPLLAGLGVVGTDHNHFLPSEAAGCAAAGVVLVKALALIPDKKRRWYILLPLVGFLVQAAVFSIPAPRYEIEFRARPADYQRQLGKIVEYAASKPGPILTSEAAFLALANRPVGPYYYNDLFTLSALTALGRYDSSGLLEGVRQKKFSLILSEGNLFTGGEFRNDVWPPDLVEAIKQNYKIQFRDVWFIYEPRN